MTNLAVEQLIILLAIVESWMELRGNVAVSTP
jgi:hypothetical protein